MDVAVAAAWAVLITRFEDIQTAWQWIAFLGSPVVVGFICGRYRVILLAAAALAVVVLLFPTQGCDTGCEDDIATWFIVAYAVFFYGVIASLMAAGVILRRRLSAQFKRVRVEEA
jgi:hypothetical protein